MSICFKCPKCGNSQVLERKTNMTEITVYDGWDIYYADIMQNETVATVDTKVTYECYNCGEDLTEYFKEENKND